MFNIYRFIAKVLWFLIVLVLYLGIFKTTTVFQEISAFALASVLALLSCAILLYALVSHTQTADKKRQQRELGMTPYPTYRK